MSAVWKDVAARNARYESDLSHAAASVAFDDGVWATDVTATFYGGDLDSRRGFRVFYAGTGVLATTGDRQATGDMRFTGAPQRWGNQTLVPTDRSHLG